MALGVPTVEDQRKIHAEINQTLNQRFLLTTLAITIFGAATGWMIPETIKCSDNQARLLFSISGLLSVVFAGIYLFSHFLRRTHQALAAYLIVTETSPFEADWLQFRRSQFATYTKPQAAIFLILLILNFSVAFYGFKQCASPFPTEGWVALVVGVEVFILIFVLGIWELFDLRSTATMRWLELKQKSE